MTGVLRTAERNCGQARAMVTSATNTNDGCGFDFGNAETSGTGNGNGHMRRLLV